MRVKTISMVISPFSENDIKELDKKTNELLIEEKRAKEILYADIISIQDTMSALREVQGAGNEFLVLRRITFK